MNYHSIFDENLLTQLSLMNALQKKRVAFTNGHLVTQNKFCW